MGNLYEYCLVLGRLYTSMPTVSKVLDAYRTGKVAGLSIDGHESVNTIFQRFLT